MADESPEKVSIRKVFLIQVHLQVGRNEGFEDRCGGISKKPDHGRSPSVVQSFAANSNRNGNLSTLGVLLSPATKTIPF